jgi:hypothetical protein
MRLPRLAVKRNGLTIGCAFGIVHTEVCLSSPRAVIGIGEVHKWGDRNGIDMVGGMGAEMVPRDS